MTIKKYDFDLAYLEHKGEIAEKIFLAIFLIALFTLFTFWTGSPNEKYVDLEQGTCIGQFCY